MKNLTQLGYLKSTRKDDIDYEVWRENTLSHHIFIENLHLGIILSTIQKYVSGERDKDHELVKDFFANLDPKRHPYDFSDSEVSCGVKNGFWRFKDEKVCSVKRLVYTRQGYNRNFSQNIYDKFGCCMSKLLQATEFPYSSI